MRPRKQIELLSFIDHGKLVATDTPEGLKKLVGKDIISVKTDDNDRAAQEIRLRYQIEARHDSEGLPSG